MFLCIHNSVYSIVQMTMCINHRSKFFLYDKKTVPSGNDQSYTKFSDMYKRSKNQIDHLKCAGKILAEE
jgi:hypothetical protein